MPWNWQGRGETSTEDGGTRGSSQEAAVAHAWPAYEASYLKKRLQGQVGKYMPPSGAANDDVVDHLYLEKISEDYKSEADECLKREFQDWLLGIHTDNVTPRPYDEAAGEQPGAPKRLGVYRENTQTPASLLNRKWKPTWWGQKSLTHLPGVREYFYNKTRRKYDHALEMNLLAEHGPQDLKSAWMYFKHWVKGRPVEPEVCMDGTEQEDALFIRNGEDDRHRPPGGQPWRHVDVDRGPAGEIPPNYAKMSPFPKEAYIAPGDAAEIVADSMTFGATDVPDMIDLTDDFNAFAETSYDEFDEYIRPNQMYRTAALWPLLAGIQAGMEEQTPEEVLERAEEGRESVKARVQKWEASETMAKALKDAHVASPEKLSAMLKAKGLGDGKTKEQLERDIDRARAGFYVPPTYTPSWAPAWLRATLRGDAVLGMNTSPDVLSGVTQSIVPPAPSVPAASPSPYDALPAGDYF